MTRTGIKERTLRLAREKFLKYGFYKVSMDNLVKDLKTSKSSVYNHFDSKEDLVKAILKKINNEINQSLEEILSDDKLTFKGKLTAISKFTKKVLIEVSAEFLDDLKTHTPDLWDAYQKMRSDRINKYYKALFESGIQEGVVRNDIDSNLILTIYLNLTEIPLQYEKMKYLEMPHEKIYEYINEVFLNGINSK